MKDGFKIDSFVELGCRLLQIPTQECWHRVVENAVEQNPWFSAEDIDYALSAICDNYLGRACLTEWLGRYEYPSKSRRIALVAAGNIPMAVFFDLMCVLIAGYECHLKLSSKDAVLMNFIIDQLLEIDPSMVVKPLSDTSSCDALIFSGGDQAAEHYKAMFATTPQLIRTSRFSVAILGGGESSDRLRLLGEDMFRYCGLGCRSVSMVFVPQDYDLQRLKACGCSVAAVEGFRNNYRYLKALRLMEGRDFIDGNGFVLSWGDDVSSYLSEICYLRYDKMSDVEEFLERNKNRLQVVVTECDIDYAACCRIGQAQRPRLEDYPDMVDVMQFLSTI